MVKHKIRTRNRGGGIRSAMLCNGRLYHIGTYPTIARADIARKLHYYWRNNGFDVLSLFER